MSELFPGLAGLPEPAPPPTPVTASAVILWRDGTRGREVFWVRRGALRFAGGFHAFPGGRLDVEDAGTPVSGASAQQAPLLACAAREAFEETGVLLVNGPPPAPEERGSARRALLDGSLGFRDLLLRHGLAVDGERLQPAGRWITPPQLPIRYDAHVFLARVPDGQDAEVWPGELSGGEWVVAEEAVARWSRGEVLLHPPNLWGLQSLARAAPPECLDLLRAPPSMDEFVSRRIEFQRGMFLAMLRTPTLPPAMHTNCWLPELGGGALAAVDPGSPWPEEQERLETVLADLAADGLTVREIWLTHAHGDHTGGVAALAARHPVLLRAHPETLERLRPSVRDAVSSGALAFEPLADGALLHDRYRALHTPGHARGHVAFLDERTGALLAGDMISTLSTIVIDPPEGDMAQYLASLARLRDLGPRTVFPAHGGPSLDAVEKLEEYLAHRRERERLVVDALATPGTLDEMTARAYPDVPGFMLPVAARSCLASLQKLAREGRARLGNGRWQRGAA